MKRKDKDLIFEEEGNDFLEDFSDEPSFPLGEEDESWKKQDLHQAPGERERRRILPEEAGWRLDLYLTHY